jgi:hypothetical protein
MLLTHLRDLWNQKKSLTDLIYLNPKVFSPEVQEILNFE